MWSGVIVMIRTITSWPTTSAMIAAATPGRRRISLIGPTLGPGSSPVARREASSASSYGSGRRRAKVRIAARPTNTIGTRYGPASSGRPAWTARSPEIGTSAGPITEPMVAPQTTMLIADARRSVGTMSPAA